MTSGPYEPPPPGSGEQSGSGQPPSGSPGYGAQPGQPVYGEPGYQAQQPSGSPGYGAPPPEGGGYGAPPQQGGYGAPPQQQGGYGPPPQQGSYAPPPSAATPYAPPRRERGLGIVGLVLAVIGAVAVLLAFLVFRWYRSSASNPLFQQANKSKFSQLHHFIDRGQHFVQAHPVVAKYIDFGVAPQYYSWLGWLLFAASVVLAVLAVLPFGLSVAARVLGILAGLAGVGLTLWALDLVSFSGPLAPRFGSKTSFTDWLSHTYIGAWLALGGFLVLAIAAATGPRRKRV